MDTLNRFDDYLQYLVQLIDQRTFDNTMQKFKIIAKKERKPKGHVHLKDYMRFLCSEVQKNFIKSVFQT